MNKKCLRCREPFDGERTFTDTFTERRRVRTPDGERQITREVIIVGTIPDNHCSNCGVRRDRRVVKHVRNRNIGGKRGRNSGKVSQHGKKS